MSTLSDIEKLDKITDKVLSYKPKLQTSRNNPAKLEEAATPQPVISTSEHEDT